MRALLARLRDSVRRRALDQEIADEIAVHLELATSEFEARGMTPEEARRAARRQFGGVSQTCEAERDARSFPWLDSLRWDLRYAVRGLVKTPTLTAVLIVTLALGIGATTAIFSAVDVALLRELPIRDPDDVVDVYTRYPSRLTSNPAGGDQVAPSSFPDYLDLKASDALADLAAFGHTIVTLTTSGASEQIGAQIVTGNYFDLLGVRPVLGRMLTLNDDRLDAPSAVVVISYDAWQRRFGGDPNVLGTTIVLNNRSLAIVGVAPRRFSGTSLGEVPEIWAPMALQEVIRPASAGALRRRLGGTRMLGARDVRWLDMVGRLNAGDTVARAAAALDVVGRQLAAAYPDTNRELTATALPLGDGPGVRVRARPTLRLLMAGVVMVLLIACANVAGILLARAIARRREVAIRVALGAGHARLVRQWLTESVLLGVIGAGAGLLVALWVAPVLQGLAPLSDLDLRLDTRVLGFAMLCGVGTGIAFGLAPVAQMLREHTVQALRDEGGAVASGARTARIRAVFVVLQVALTLVLLVTAGLFVRTFQRALAVDLGYSLDRMLVLLVTPPDSATPQQVLTAYDSILDNVNALPGVQSAAAARVTVLSGASRTVMLSGDGGPILTDRTNVLVARANVVSQRYFATLGIPIDGRDFTAADTRQAPRVAIVSRALGRRLFSDANPVGRTFVMEDSTRLEIVGVASDAVYRSATETEPPPVFYLPLSQSLEYGVTLHVRTKGEPLAMLSSVQRAIKEADASVVVTTPRRLSDEYRKSTQTQRTMAQLGGILSIIALMLAAIGLYGVMAYAAQARTVEMGIRLALGCTRSGVIWLILTKGLLLVIGGSVLGVAAAAASLRLIRSQLFGVDPGDPVTWLGVSTVLVIVVAIACAVPARRMMKINPVEALRTSW